MIVSHAKILWILRKRFPNLFRNRPVPKVTKSNPNAHTPNGRTNEKNEKLNSCSCLWPWSAKTALVKHSTINEENNIINIDKGLVVCIFIRAPLFFRLQFSADKHFQLSYFLLIISNSSFMVKCVSKQHTLSIYQ